ncbi:MAG: hypothetical protein B6U89_02635 [Desulfurococcales archaeon ex4484_58]|nr:MAG: hypothetical protein B6U89_02635 [Desulfurococcales archaeon ex4484_58]
MGKTIDGHLGKKRIMDYVEKLFEIEKKEGEIPIKLYGAVKQLLSEKDRFKETPNNQYRI